MSTRHLRSAPPGPWSECVTVGDFKNNYRQTQTRAEELVVNCMGERDMSELAALQPTLLQRLVYEGYVGMEWTFGQMHDQVSHPRLMRESHVPPPVYI